MPLYEYRCPSCSSEFEWLQSVGESAAKVRCPDCGGGGVERRLSTFAVANGGGVSESLSADAGCGRAECGGGFCAGSGAGAADWN